MRCPFCGSEDTKVVDSRSYLEGNSIKRRRECVICQRRFSTFERVEEVPLYVIKKDQRRVPFNREKVMRGLTFATVKRNIGREDLEKIVYEVEKNIQNTLKNEITTRELGEMILEKLKKIDQVAYVRFASVYKEFDDVKSFLELIEEMEREKK
ncbi:transcriptional regulator NrdR [Fusobacterium necrophorum subsp. funduliforme]|uniref:Transcriptional repressor NrdR n=4 Tax=Fusobacterium necrophorum TaxID=859 RepID=A0AAN4ASX7_9FUSO|nr:transcriptional regulator NrdR [Fusobacterium necrophorum]EHO17898.1 transcriptional regulator NrdR [Fusobacterium necrophorum subsp. funduliforme 1_1_36S]AVQ22144.1 transcriptional repressor NrdR [Fusobacterium necrophorum subsp. funduliforme]AYV93675.1 transcriptional repressor NrdR [Fusobacterium necrophorum subsp. funduliforme]AYV95843.1 transcriptional repressor NrdR [Fusobacterium necrophorum subsp. funduliforme]EFS23637.1 transcriptional regulator NrdR [Fusobacterium necrophorum D12]